MSNFLDEDDLDETREALENLKREIFRRENGIIICEDCSEEYYLYDEGSDDKYCSKCRKIRNENECTYLGCTNMKTENSEYCQTCLGDK